MRGLPLDHRGALPEPFRGMVEEELQGSLARQGKYLASVAPQATALVDELSRLLAAGGKRLRPVFCYWGYRAGGGSMDRSIARAGAAVEMLHTSALIHDDVIDSSALRRGEPTTFRELARDHGGRADAHFGRSAAILAGDLAQAFADELLAQSGFAPERVLAAFEDFNRMRVDAVGGEFLDLLATGGGSGDEESIRRAGSLKAGSYSVVGPLRLGAALAAADPSVVDALSRFGRPLGEAFQLRDDVLGTFGDPHVTGKDRDGDIREGKQTALVARLREVASPGIRRMIGERSGEPGLSTEQVEEVRAAMRDSGVVDQTLSLIGSLVEQARASLRSAPLPAEVDSALSALAELVEVRDL